MTLDGSELQSIARCYRQLYDLPILHMGTGRNSAILSARTSELLFSGLPSNSCGDLVDEGSPRSSMASILSEKVRRPRPTWNRKLGEAQNSCQEFMWSKFTARKSSWANPAFIELGSSSLAFRAPKPMSDESHVVILAHSSHSTSGFFHGAYAFLVLGHILKGPVHRDQPGRVV